MCAAHAFLSSLLASARKRIATLFLRWTAPPMLAAIVLPRPHVVDALAPLGVEHLDMPLLPEKLWRVLQKTGGAG